MRIRRKPWARPELAACPFCIDDPENHIGHWHELFPTHRSTFWRWTSRATSWD